MASKGTIGKGLLLGGAAVAVWAMSRKATGKAPRLINWDRVRNIAFNMSGAEGLTEDSARTEIGWRYQQWVKRSEDVISDYLGKQLPKALQAVHVFDRLDWIDANIENFEEMFDSFERINAKALQNGSTGAHLMGGINQFFITSQMGALMGYLAQRVLGQYDATLLGKEAVGSGKLYFVEPNIAGLQERLGLDPEDFRLWIALHESTHAFEFEAHPWLRGYMNGLLSRYLESVTGDLGKVQGDGSGLGALASRVAGNVFKGGNFMEWVMAPEQKAIFRELQALMCLVEGYSNHVMQAVGEKLLPSYHTMKARFDERGKQKSAAEQIFTRLTGMDVKMEQYALGERFVNEIVKERGIDFMNKVWDSPAMLPSLDEIQAPKQWIARIDRMIN